jgi:hypothetical protein
VTTEQRVELERALFLVGVEARAREIGRSLELYPTHQQEARRAFRRASAARRLRMALLRRCQLV